MTLNTFNNTIHSSIKQRQQLQTYHQGMTTTNNIKVKQKSQKQKYQLQTYFYNYEK